LNRVPGAFGLWDLVSAEMQHEFIVKRRPPNKSTQSSPVLSRNQHGPSKMPDQFTFDNWHCEGKTEFSLIAAEVSQTGTS
jgi:hypothetical protein